MSRFYWKNLNSLFKLHLKKRSVPQFDIESSLEVCWLVLTTQRVICTQKLTLWSAPTPVLQTFSHHPLAIITSHFSLCHPEVAPSCAPGPGETETDTWRRWVELHQCKCVSERGVRHLQEEPGRGVVHETDRERERAFSHLSGPRMKREIENECWMKEKECRPTGWGCCHRGRV